jgi:hypothetical protein
MKTAVTILIVESVESAEAIARMDDHYLLLVYAVVVLGWSIKIA